jgi:lysophospholipase L1-like esterase
MVRTLLLAMIAAAACARIPGGAPGRETPLGARPIPRDEAWLSRHEALVAEARAVAPEVLFLGDSITDGWRTPPARALWDRHFAPLKAANLGISGDRTRHVLWRLENGILSCPAPRVVVLLIGTNDVGQIAADPPSSAIAGIRAIVARIQAAWPRTRILLLAVFPRGRTAKDPHRATVAAINAGIRDLDDQGRSVLHLDLGPRFLEEDGSLPAQVMPDFLHLSEWGYRIWAEALIEPLRRLLD